MTDTEIRLNGVRALIRELGRVDAERFIALVMREPFDYTKWQRTLWPDQDLENTSKAAMASRQKQ